MSAADEMIGHILDGRYKVLEPISEGAMGVVYRGERLKLGRPVAIKVLRDELPNELASRKRFEIEAMAMAKLEHPHCVSVLDVGLHEDKPYVVMDFVSGTNLREILDRDGALDVARAAEIMRQVLSGLAHAHELGIMHRDIKPANVMLSKKTGIGDQIKILDFGLARPLEGPSNLTGSMMVLGTPAYMAPEQSSGGVIDARTDLYACGVLLFELVTGKKPFHSEKDDPIEVVRMHLDKPPPRLDAVALGRSFGELEAVVARALAKSPADRYQTAGELAGAIAAATGIRPPATKPVEPKAEDLSWIAPSAVAVSAIASEKAIDKATDKKAAKPSGKPAKPAGKASAKTKPATVEDGWDVDVNASRGAATTGSRDAAIVVDAKPLRSAAMAGASRASGESATSGDSTASGESAASGDSTASGDSNRSSDSNGGSGGSAISTGEAKPTANEDLSWGLPKSAPPPPSDPVAEISAPRDLTLPARTPLRTYALAGGIVVVLVVVAIVATKSSGSSPSAAGNTSPLTPDAAVVAVAPTIVVGDAATPEPIDDGPGKVLHDASELAAAGKLDAAITMVRDGRKQFYANPDLPLLAGKLYFAHHAWSDGIVAFREAFRLDDTQRTPEIAQLVVQAFLTTPERNVQLAAFVRDDLGRLAAPILDQAVANGSTQVIRQRATAERARLKK